MRFDVAPDPETLSRRAAATIVRALGRKPDLLLGVATGASPERTYALLAQARKRTPARFRQLRILTLDEWLGLPARHPVTCATYVREHILGPLAIGPGRHRGFRGATRSPGAECRRMARWLAKHGPIDICVLGVGTNGHLLLNEPAAHLDPAIHRALLAPSTRRHPMLRGSRKVPTHGLTLGLGDILRARKILLLVSGPHKRAALRTVFAGQVTAACPATFLWLHPDVTVYYDEAAAP